MCEETWKDPVDDTDFKAPDPYMKATETAPNLQQLIWIQDKEFVFEVDTGAGDNFCSTDIWGPATSPGTGHYEVANGQPLPTLGLLRQ